MRARLRVAFLRWIARWMERHFNHVELPDGTHLARLSDEAMDVFRATLNAMEVAPGVDTQHDGDVRRWVLPPHLN